MAEEVEQDAGIFARNFPNITAWLRRGGYVEIGYTEYTIGAFVRALDEGGLVYEGRTEYASIDEALADLDAGIAGWVADNPPGRP